jgi:hypothetical protein
MGSTLAIAPNDPRLLAALKSMGLTLDARGDYWVPAEPNNDDDDYNDKLGNAADAIRWLRANAGRRLAQKLVEAGLPANAMIESTTRNPAQPRTGYKPAERAKLTPRHFSEADTKLAQQAVAEAIQGRGKLLGVGNFGSVYVVVRDNHPWIVKIGTRETAHSRSEWGRPYSKYAQRPRTTGQMREEIVHEAGIANALWGQGFRCIPATVYAQHKGVVALVREYGDLVPVGSLRFAEYDALADCLVSVIDAGFVVSDDLLVARRLEPSPDGTAPRGSLFVADVGFWRTMPAKRGGKFAWQAPYADALRELWRLLRMIAPGAIAGGRVGTSWQNRVDGPPSHAEIRYAEEEVEEADQHLTDYIARKGATGARFIADQVRRTRERTEGLREVRAKAEQR